MKLDRPSAKLAQSVLAELQDIGVQEIALCAGARNAVFVEALSAPSAFQVFTFFDERSAGFFALGRTMASGRPVAVITTSGTAAAELLPAAIEAFYQGRPLVLVTADRPKRFRGTGAPQSMEQVGLFSHYVEASVDLNEESTEDVSGVMLSLKQWRQQSPFHLNVCLEDPIRARMQPPSIQNSGRVEIEKFTSPLLIVSGLSPAQAERVLPILERVQRPMILEATSQLRSHPRLAQWELQFSEHVANNPAAGSTFDSVWRVGGVPTTVFWRALEDMDQPVFHFSDRPFRGLARAGSVLPLDHLASIADRWRDAHGVASVHPSDSSAVLRDDQELHKKCEALLRKYPLSEPGFVRRLSEQIPSGDTVFLGNSLPIREWDFASVNRPRTGPVVANRGMNGIDGLISTFLGLNTQSLSSWAVVGDLSALYDLNAPWVTSQLTNTDVHLVVINNGGGRIFHRMFGNPLFENRHQVELSDWAKMWGWDYVKWQDGEVLQSGKGPRVIEIFPSEQQTKDFWNDWVTL